MKISDSQIEFSKSLGEIGQVLILLSFTYVAIFYLYRYKNKIYPLFRMGLSNINYFNQNMFDQVQRNVRKYYRKIRKPLLYFHAIVNLSATVIGSVHGYNMLSEASNIELISGVILFSSMLMMSISGIIVLFRIKFSRISRYIFRVFRSSHKQWILTIIIIITLLLHGD